MSLLHRKNFILDVYNKKINVENFKWTELEDKYDYPEPTSKKGDKARKHFKWYDTIGTNIGQWSPGNYIADEDISVEELQDEKKIEHSYLIPTEDITSTKEWQEFLAFKKEKSEQRTFLPGVYVLMGCTHVPFHNKPFFNAVVNMIKDTKPTGLVLAGDFMDMNSVSSHDKGQKPIAPHVTLSWEYTEGNTALDILDAAADWKVKHYLYGNHEDRFWRETRKADTAKLGSALINPTTALQLRERGYQVQEKWKEAKVYLGKHLEVVHGEFCNISTAKKHMDAFRTSIAFFHTHRIQSYMEGDTAGYNLGWGGGIDEGAFGYASKAQRNTWKNGIGVVTIDELGGYHMQQVIWHNDRFYYNGKMYS